jgi:hypothetical protein
MREEGSREVGHFLDAKDLITNVFRYGQKLNFSADTYPFNILINNLSGD